MRAAAGCMHVSCSEIGDARLQQRDLDGEFDQTCTADDRSTPFDTPIRTMNTHIRHIAWIRYQETRGVSNCDPLW